MTLILLLLVLVTERVALQGAKWQALPYLTWYIEKCQKQLLSNQTSNASLLLFIGIPALVAFLIIHLFDLGLIDFIVSSLVLAVCIGNEKIRSLYRQYLNAESREDSEAMSLYQAEMYELAIAKKVRVNDASEINVDAELETSAEQSEKTATIDDNSTEESASEDDLAKEETVDMSSILIWCNFKYYAAPIFYFVLFGAPGVVFYATLIYLDEMNAQRNNIPVQFGQRLQLWVQWAYWLPARFVSIGFMFVGHFTNSLEAYLKLAANFSVSGFDIITQVADAAEPKGVDNHSKNMVKLAKRNMVLFVVVVALLTLYGYIV